MSDVHIHHAKADRIACERLAAALGHIGLSVTWDKAVRPKAEQSQEARSAAAKVVMWSRGSVESSAIKADGISALENEANGNAPGRSRYVGLIIDDTPPSTLPEPFANLETPIWTTWFEEAAISYDDARFISLLSVLENLTDRRNLMETARTLAVKDAEATRLRALVAAQDEALTHLRSSTTRLEASLAAQTSTLAERDAEAEKLRIRNSELGEKLAAADEDREQLTSRLRGLDEQLRNAADEREGIRAALEAEREVLQQTRTAKQSLESELDDARNGMAAALRQQKALQGQIEADDQTIRHIMTQREDLLQIRDRLEKDRVRALQNLADAERRLVDSEQRRETYVVALVERKKEIDLMSEKLASSVSDAQKSLQKVDGLQRTVQGWGHVPWRGIAAGSLAAGALIAAGFIYTGRAIEAFFAEPGQVAATRPTVTEAPPVMPAKSPALDPTPEKNEAKIAPDTLQIVNSDDLTEPQAVDPAQPGPGEIPIPEESATPPGNDQVQFNPDGLPPIDPDSRPPPQDLPPMQQKPKLLLKPVIAPTENNQ